MAKTTKGSGAKKVAPKATKPTGAGKAAKPAAKTAAKPAAKTGAKSGAKPGASGKGFDLAGRLAKLPASAASDAPSMPVKVAILEAERVWTAARPLRTKFSALPGFDAAQFESVPHLIAALEDAERTWSRARIAQHGKGLVKTRTEAEAARAAVMGAGRYLLRKDAAAQTELDRIAQGDGLADLVADLDDVAALVEKYAAVFALDPGIGKSTPKDLRALATTLRQGEDSTANLDVQAARNRVFAALESALGEIRAAAGYLYKSDPRRLAPFRSHYEALRKRASRKAAKASPAPVAAAPPQ